MRRLFLYASYATLVSPLLVVKLNVEMNSKL